MQKLPTLKFIIVLILFLSGCFFTYGIFSAVTLSEPVSFTINEGESLKSLSKRLGDSGLVTSPIFLRLYLSFNGKDRKVQLGEYQFSGTLSIFGLAKEITETGPKSPLLSVTVPEGSTSQEVFQIFVKALPSLDYATFFELVKTREAEGKLFPSTYHLLPSYKESNLITLVTNVYLKKVTPILRETELPKPLATENDVLTLASIVEGEANTEKDMRIVAGILLERMRIGMPLQVDVATSTYKVKGLPLVPINNPGLTSITAVINPTYTDYLYYITGKDGLMYYAKTFNDHKRNIQKYLK